MKKRRNPKVMEIISIQNPVAKYAHQFNKAQIFFDKTKYRRKEKHAKQEVFPIHTIELLEKPPVSSLRAWNFNPNISRH
ncbi:hypothetical protein METHB2_70017 [Candidatus Methylobacter favarea]|uniref:Uncharacterized protein n=1 Tax=Candidatus Methylobacter favarea TaxID=2707345 RepID=A0A8S0WL56_9GAMM|nr:hypothetical protein [Candidatus Methylobacter favarea]CAA9892410.1 hypothetical protein METHB2_70017 [Candidatus Methylobacter favarea]